MQRPSASIETPRGGLDENMDLVRYDQVRAIAVPGICSRNVPMQSEIGREGASSSLARKDSKRGVKHGGYHFLWSA